MLYPIFNSIVNQIENQLNQKDLNIKTFKTWHQDRISAKGLETVIDVSSDSEFIKEVLINFDWDRFREMVLAQQLEGLGNHPMLQKNTLKSVTVLPKIDIEVSWIFDEKNTRLSLPKNLTDTHSQTAGEWMQTISKKVNHLLTRDDGITRWHFEIEGTYRQRRLTAVKLISYFRYSLANLKSLNETHAFINRRIEELMVKSIKVRDIARETLGDAASGKAS